MVNIFALFALCALITNIFALPQLSASGSQPIDTGLKLTVYRNLGCGGGKYTQEVLNGPVAATANTPFPWAFESYRPSRDMSGDELLDFSVLVAEGPKQDQCAQIVERTNPMSGADANKTLMGNQCYQFIGSRTATVSFPDRLLPIT